MPSEDKNPGSAVKGSAPRRQSRVQDQRHSESDGATKFQRMRNIFA